MVDSLWYFDVNGVSEIPDGMLGEGQVVRVLDSCIDFENSLSLNRMSSPDDDECAASLKSQYIALMDDNIK